MIPTLLIVADFTLGANSALTFALPLAQSLAARFVLLHVPPSLASSDLSHPGRHLSLPQRNATQALTRLLRTLPVPAVGELGVGPVAEVLQAVITRHRPALVVLSRPAGATPGTLVTRPLLDLLRRNAGTLVVVPDSPLKAPFPQRVLLAADGARFQLGSGGEFLRTLLEAVRAHLIVGHVTESATQHTAPQALEAVLQTGIARNLPAVATTHVCHAEPAAGILQAVREQHADLLVVVARPHTLLWELFHQSVTAQLIQRSLVPVLVVPAQLEAPAVNAPTALTHPASATP